MTDDEINALYTPYASYVEKTFKLQIKKQRDAGIWISKSDEDELYSRVLAKIARYLPRHDPSKSSITTYLYTIVATQVKWCLLRMRGRSWEARNNAMLHYDDKNECDAMSIPEPVQPRTVADVLEELPEDLRKMALLLLEGHNRKATARLMGWSRDNLNRKLAQLREHLDGEPLH